MYIEMTKAYAQFQMMNEHDLHYKVIDFIRNYLPQAIVIPGMGELQATSAARVDAWKKGYKSGQPDILIANKHKHYTGLTIEMNTPAGTGKVSSNQSMFLDSLKQAGYLTVISNDYDHIIMTLMDYFKDVRFQCPECYKALKSKETLDTHLRVIHQIEIA